MWTLGSKSGARRNGRPFESERAQLAHLTEVWASDLAVLTSREERSRDAIENLEKELSETQAKLLEMQQKKDRWNSGGLDMATIEQVNKRLTEEQDRNALLQAEIARLKVAKVQGQAGADANKENLRSTSRSGRERSMSREHIADEECWKKQCRHLEDRGRELQRKIDSLTGELIEARGQVVEYTSNDAGHVREREEDRQRIQGLEAEVRRLQEELRYARKTNEISSVSHGHGIDTSNESHVRSNNTPNLGVVKLASESNMDHAPREETLTESRTIREIANDTQPRLNNTLLSDFTGGLHQHSPSGELHEHSPCAVGEREVQNAVGKLLHKYGPRISKLASHGFGWRQEKPFSDVHTVCDAEDVPCFDKPKPKPVALRSLSNSRKRSVSPRSSSGHATGWDMSQPHHQQRYTPTGPDLEGRDLWRNACSAAAENQLLRKRYQTDFNNMISTKTRFAC